MFVDGNHFHKQFTFLEISTNGSYLIIRLFTSGFEKSVRLFRRGRILSYGERVIVTPNESGLLWANEKEGDTMPAIQKRTLQESAPREFMNVKQVAEMLCFSTRTVYEMLANGEIPGRKIGNRWFIHRNTLIAFITDSTAA